MKAFKAKRRIWIAGAVGITIVVGIALYQLPFVQERIGWRIDFLIAELYYRINPPEERAFIPDPSLAASVDATLEALTLTPTHTSTSGPSSTPTISPTPTSSPTPLPEEAALTGLAFEYQKLNNCGPANLAMALSFWGWQGDQRDTAAFLKPNVQDKNVMPYEMAEFIEQETHLEVVVRVGGDIELMKAFIASGFPVLLEKSYDVTNNDLGWMGHYQVLFAYDENRDRFIGQDSYVGPNQPVPYESLITEWRGFNFTFLVAYPQEDESEILEILGPHADEVVNIQLAAQKASNEIFSTTGRDQFFAWFNRGSNLVLLQDYAGAAAAYDEAFALRASLNLTRNTDPWRIMWYQTGPYWAYFYTGRYWDVLNLATITLDEENPKKPQLEESHYWRGMAKEALGDISGAIADFQISLEYHPDFEPSLFALRRLGISP